MYTLFIDTHSDKIIIILFKNQEIMIKKEVPSMGNTSKNSMPILIETLQEVGVSIEEVEKIIVVHGPGSFTGIRLGVTMAKTLAYTLQIPIVQMSSLLIKAVSFTHDSVKIVEREKNGVFVGTFTEDNQLIKDYQYIPTTIFKSLPKEEYVEEVCIDYLKVLKYAKTLPCIHPHAVNPLYIKRIEVLK